MLKDTIESVVARGDFVLGEYTTESGPHLDDHFFVLVSPTMGDQVWAEGDPELARVRSAVNAHAGFEVTGLLFHSTTFASRVLFPPSLRGHDLYTFFPAKRGWIVDLLFPGVSHALTEEVEHYLSKSSDR